MAERDGMHPVSILFPAIMDAMPPPQDVSTLFADLAIDRILAAVTAGFEAYDLKPLFSCVPHDRAVIDYRQAVLRDTSDQTTGAVLRRFATEMRRVREQADFAEKSHYPHQQAARFVTAIGHYCDGLVALADGLDACSLYSKGLTTFRTALREHVASPGFGTLRDGVAENRSALGAIRYTVLIRDSMVTVRDFEVEPDYNAVIAGLFAKFQQGRVKSHEFESNRSTVTMNHVEAEILNGVALLNPPIFAKLHAFVASHRDFIDPVIRRFDRESHFYIVWLDFTGRLAANGLDFCYPELVADHVIRVTSGFDLALAEKLRVEKRHVVTNDFHLEDKERIFVVTGPNQGGKTTFARMVGQMHYFANLGCTVPGRSARLHLLDRIFAHFEREEVLTTLRGKLHDDLVRIRAILDAATSDSLIVLNEIFNSTALKDASFLAEAVLRRIIARGALAVCVTFMDELSVLGPETVSVTSMVQPDDPAERSFKVVRRPADGLAYALSIAEKYGVTYRRLKERRS
ncbi:DNA mismatch repair protein MutS [Acidiphilium sp. AL]|uniref:DNA mismatch repair protein MutS n=1 Tax=Acidiphilium iwatense TaxID=768198 RepID=A0ABS9DXD0_9PROT|nr:MULTISPECIES: DNA mismatch repair protein MutS [Acidiphilium]MCF3946107.1 DNA mismatch repair protein MutS [Acidiphilium iwatense]MCU4160977.1 DNA mismatch repair protein MutS [Acidiphilium sp. AL]